MRGGRVGSLAASPTLVGAVTVLVVTVAVFLAYQANSGLPFVPTYQLSAQLPDANSMVKGNDVRIGGQRVGQITAITPENVTDAPCPIDPTRQCTGQVAKVDMDLNKDLEQLPEDSTIVVRSKSALGLKYLQINRGDSSQGFKAGSTMPLSAARPEPVEIDQVFNMFDSPTRTAIQANLLEFGNALAGRGVDLNAAIGQLKPLVELLTPVMRNLADPNTGLSNFVSSLSATAAEVAPVAEIQGQLFADLDTTFAALRPRLPPLHPGVDLEVAGGGGHRDRDAADDPALPRQHGQALQRAAARASMRSRRCRRWSARASSRASRRCRSRRP